MESNNVNVDNNNIQSNWNQHDTTLTTKRCYHAAVAMDEHRILITGGSDGNNRNISSSVEILDATNATTSTVPDMNGERVAHQSIRYKNDVYVIGGFGNSGTLNTVEIININNLSSGWTRMSAMNEERHRFAAALYDKYIYVFGGYNGRSSLSSVERFDIPNNKWEMVNSNMNMKRRGHAAVTVGNKIYIIGGQDENDKKLDSIEIFDISSNTFQQGNIPNIPIALSYMSAIAIGKWIIVTGGENNEDGRISDSYIYDTEQNVWKDDIKCSKLNVGRNLHTATVLGGDTIYICGGEDNNFNTLDSIEYISFEDLTGISINDRKNRVVGVNDTPTQDADRLDSLSANRENTVVAINDTPNQYADRLGYSSYARALASVAQKAEGPNTSFCVGLNAPWGAGKSFLYKLVKAELERNNEEKIKKDIEKRNNKEEKEDDEQKGIFMKPFKFLNDKEILSSMRTRVNRLWNDLNKETSEHPCTNIVHFIIFFALAALICAMHILAYLMIGIFGVLPWSIWCVLVYLFSESTNVAFCRIIHIIQEVPSSDHNAVQIAAMLIMTPFIWFLPWVVLFIFSCIDQIFAKLLCSCKEKTPVEYNKLPNNQNRDEEQGTTNDLDTNNVNAAGKESGNNNNKDEEEGAEKIEGKKKERNIAEEVLCILKGKGKTSQANTRFATAIVTLWQSLLFWHTEVEQEYPQKEDAAIYINVEFNAWVYNGSDQLWTSILIEIWKAIGNLYGHNKLRQYRASVELQRSLSKNKNATTDTTNSKSVYQARADLIRSFNMKSFISAFGAVVVTGITTYLKYNSKIRLYWVPILIGLGVIPIGRQMYIFIRYVLPKPWVLQIDDKASRKRHDLLNNTGYKGLVKDELEYILDFLRYTPYIDEENKCKRRPHLCISVDDIDRCDGDTVMSVLEAVILLLVDAPVTCWLALDTRLVVAAIEEAKKDVLDAAGVSGNDFMEKIIELPFCIPDLNYEKKKNFVSRLFLQGHLADPVHLLKEINNSSEKFSNSMRGFDVYVATDDKEKNEAAAAHALVRGLERVVNNQDEIGFNSGLVKDQKEIVERINKKIAVDIQNWHSIDTKQQEDFLFLVCEWIEWVLDDGEKYERNINIQQDGAVNENASLDELPRPTKQKGEEEGKEEEEKEEEEKEEEEKEVEEKEVEEKKKEERKGEEKEELTIITPVFEDEENPQRKKVDSSFKTMVTKKEKKWFLEQYVKYMSGKPRTITRIVNNYVVARFVAVELNSNQDDAFKKKLVKIIILAEQWPYRLSWLMQLAEDACQESLIKHKQKEVNNSKDVVSELKHLGLNIVNTGITDAGHHEHDVKNADDGKEEKRTTFVDDQESTLIDTLYKKTKQKQGNKGILLLKTERNHLFAKLDKAVLDNEHAVKDYGKKIDELSKQIEQLEKVQDILLKASDAYTYWRKQGKGSEMAKHKLVMLKAKSIVKGYILTSDEMNENDSEANKNIISAIEENAYNCLNNLSLLDVYQQMVKTLLHSPGENAAKLLSQDGDPQVFEQLLAEDASDLKLIDLALPLEFKNQELNDKFKTLRPFMINMSRYMIEKTAKYMETCVIHENRAHNKGQGGSPKLLFQSSKSHYKKGEK